MRPLYKDLTLLGHFLELLFAHRPTQQVRAAERVTSQHLGRLHDLFLVNHDAVGFPADWLQERMFVFNSHLAVAARDEFRDQLHRSGPIQRNQRGDMFHRADLELPAQIPHAARFQLKHAYGLRAKQQEACRRRTAC